ncbi:MAG: O-antigen ligase family protein, partial [Candidatus Paceibacterota bacterium]
MAFAIYLFSQQVNFGTSTFFSTELLKKYVTPVVIKFKTLRSRLCNRYQWLQKMRLFRKDRFIVQSFFWKRLGSGLQRTFSKSNISQIFCIDRVVKLLSLITLVSILLVLPASKSRASWLAVLIASCYLMISFYPARKRIGIILNALWKKMVAAMLSCVILAASGFAVYSLKKDSADGRLLIWKVSTKMIKDQPVVGHGFNTFQAHYMDYQAAYFIDNPGSEEAYYADNISYPFNEYIKALGEQGVLGCMLLFSIVIILILLSRDKFDFYIIIAKAGILSLAVFAFFSYPSEILPIKVNAVILLAIAAQRGAANGIGKINLTGLGIKMVKILRWSIPIISIVLVTIIYPPIKNLRKAYCNWDEAYLLYNFEDYKSSIDSYKS